jgi:uncharacterized membrane protein YesL
MAGIFGFLDYSKPGKGVKKDEPQKPRFMFFWELFFRKFWKLIQLNFLFVAFSLPIVTIGPATAGMVYVLRNMATERPVFLFSDFWDGFKNNLLQSFALSLLAVAAGIVTSVSWGYYSERVAASSLMIVPLALCGMMILLFVLMAFYAPLMIVTLELKLRNILKNAAIHAIVCLKTNLLTLLFTGLTVLVTYLFLPISALLIVLILPAFVGFIVCFNSFPGIKRYVIDPFVAQNGGGQDAGTEAVFEDKIIGG